MKKEITGKDLIDMGYKQGAWFGKVINYFKTNEVDEENIREVIESFIPKYKVVMPHDTPVPYDKFIDCVNDEELENLISAEADMDAVMTSPTVIGGAIMPDVCSVGRGHIPVGGLAIVDNAIHPGMHSSDICCSVMITGFGNNKPEDLLDRVNKFTDFGSGPRKKPGKFSPPEEFMQRMEKNPFFSKKAIALATSHMATQGDGNHFAFVGTSKNTGETCLITHHGSRGVGAEVYKLGMACADKWRKILCPTLDSTNAYIPYDTQDGKDYWDALQMVREWTKLNHLSIHNNAKEKFKYTSKLHFWNEHNFVFKRDNLFFHAKGSTPMLDEFLPDNDTGLRLIPLNMAEPVLIVSNHPENKLGFAPHGAGRNLSRTKFLAKNLELSKDIEGLDIRFYFGLPDMSEYPSAYKNAKQVKEQIVKFKLAKIEDEIIPYGCIMAGNNPLSRKYNKEKDGKNII